MNKILDLSVIKSTQSFFPIMISVFIALLLGTMLNIFSLSTNLLLYAISILGLLAFVKFEYGIYIILLLSIIGGLFSFDLPGIPPIYFVEVMLTILLFVWGISILIYRRKFVSSPINKPLLLILLWSVVSMIGAQHRGVVVSETYKYQINAFIMLFFTIVSYFIIANHISSKQVVKYMIFSIIISSVPMSMYQYYLFFTQANMKIGYFDRVSSIFSGGFLSVYYLMVFLLLVNLFFYYKKDKIKQILIGLGVIILLFNIIITFARAVFIATVASISVLIFLQNKKFIASILFCLSILFLIYPRIVSPIVDTYSIKGTGARIDIARDACRIIKKYPLFGVGLDNYRNYTHYYYRGLSGYSRPMCSAHNDYLQIGVNIGIVGILLFFWFLWNIWRETFLVYKFTQDKFFKSIVASFLATILGFSITALAGEVIFGAFGNGGYQMFSPRLYFWVLIGIIVGIKNLEKVERNTLK